MVVEKINFVDVTDRVQVVNGVSFLQVDDKVYMLSKMEDLPDAPPEVPATPTSAFDDPTAVAAPTPSNGRGRVGTQLRCPDATALGKRIKAKRVSMDLTVEDFAELAGVSCGQVWNWQAGRFSQVTETLKDALKVWKIKGPPRVSCLWSHPKTARWHERSHIATV